METRPERRRIRGKLRKIWGRPKRDSKKNGNGVSKLRKMQEIVKAGGEKWSQSRRCEKGCIEKYKKLNENTGIKIPWLRWILKLQTN